MRDDPQATLRAWLPHMLMLALLGLALWLLAAVFAPIRVPLFAASSLALLTYTVLFEPIDATSRRTLRFLSDEWRRRVAAVCATMALVFLIVSPIVLMLLSSLSLQDTWTVITGLASRDPVQVGKLAVVAEEKVRGMVQVYPDLPIDPKAVSSFLTETLSVSSNQAMFGYVFKGTGGFVAKVVLGILLLIYIFEHGPSLLKLLLSYTPLDAKHRVELRRRFRHTVLRLLTDTVGSALVKGVAMGLIAWAIGEFPFFIIAAVSAFVALIPVVGFAFVWLPLASLLWSQEYHLRAVCLGLASVALAFLIQRLGARISRHLEASVSWMSILLFLSLVGGILSFGALGFLVGPTAVVVIVVLGSFWLPLYGVGDPDQPPRSDGPLS
jgi:predicted PurR-regulated permease PerM